jgi:hypothetical protein
MKLSWLEVFRKYPQVRFEDGKKASITKIKIAVREDLDYQLEIANQRGSIYRHDLEGKVWGVYVNSPGHKKRRGIWNALNQMGLEQTQAGDIEGCWIFPAEKLDEVVTIMGMRKRYKQRKKRT